MAEERDMWDRFDLELFCQHCGQYLTSRVGIERKDLNAARAEVRREAKTHARAAGRAVEVTFYITLKRAEIVEPQTTE
jgi:hypothetical protein